MKISDLKTAEQVLAEDLKDPEFRREWERTALARAVAVQVLAYRVDHGMSQRALAAKLEMKQPAIARLEVGEVTPSMETLMRLSKILGLEFHMNITPAGLNISA